MAATMFACPGCGEPTAAGTVRCGHCRIRLTGDLAVQLWRLDQQLAALRAQRDALVAALRSDDVLAVPTPGWATSARPGGETRRLLLALGAVCLIAALTAGTALIWPALGVGGQTFVLLLLTAGLLGGAVLLRRLPATGEALAAVGVAAVVVDLVAGRRLVAPDLSGGASHGYWLVGSLAAAAVLAAVAASARWLRAPAVGAVIATYGAVVAAVYPGTVGGVALVGVIGVAVSLVVLRGRSVLPEAATTTAAIGLVAFAATGVFASLGGADSSGLAVWCGIALGVAAPSVTARREIAAAGGVLVGAVLLLGHVVGLGSTAVVSAAFAGALLLLVPAPGVWPGQRRVASFVLGGALAVELAAQMSMQLVAVQGRDLTRAATGLGIVAVLGAAATMWFRGRHDDVAGAFAMVGAAAFVGAVAEVLGGTSALAAADGAGVVAGVMCALAVMVAALVPRTDALIAGSVATATGVCASVAVGYSLDLRSVTTAEAYVVAPAVVCIALGIVAMARLPQLSSWALLPAALVSLTPTLALAMGGDLGRQVAILAVGGLLVALAAQLRLVCPLTVGAVAVVMVTARLLGPEIVQLPRWLSLSVLGACLLLLGATWEHRLQDARAAADRLRPLVAALR